MTRARRAYEKRTQLQLVSIRLDSVARERLERLAAKHGSKRAAVELALALLDSKSQSNKSSVKDSFGVRAILPRPEGRGLPRN